MHFISFSIGLPQLNLLVFIGFLFCSQSKQFNCLYTQCMQFHWKVCFLPDDLQIGNIFAFWRYAWMLNFFLFILELYTSFQFLRNFWSMYVPDYNIVCWILKLVTCFNLVEELLSFIWITKVDCFYNNNKDFIRQILFGQQY